MPLALSNDEAEMLDKMYKDKKIESFISKMASDDSTKQSDLIKKKNIKFSDFKELPDRDKLIYYLSEKTQGFVGADIESLVREAAMLALRENIESKEVRLKNFEEALKKVSGSVSKSDIDRYRKIETDYLKSAKAALERPIEYLG